MTCRSHCPTVSKDFSRMEDGLAKAHQRLEHHHDALDNLNNRRCILGFDQFVFDVPKVANLKEYLPFIAGFWFVNLGY